MRPKKVILCVDANEQNLSVRAFLLETRGFRVITANSSRAALAILKASPFDSIHLLLCELALPKMNGNELVRRAKDLHPGISSMIVSATVASFPYALAADVFLPKAANIPAEVIERVRILVARKRGPRKHRYVAQGVAA